MKTLLFIIALIASESVLSSDFNQLVLETLNEMPDKGGYELTELPAKKLQEAFTLTSTRLTLDPFIAVPSYCTTATYIVFYKSLEKYWDENSVSLPLLELRKLMPALEKDGHRVWGRWNSNGPGTAKLVHDLKIGQNFDDIKFAKGGDFIKIFWNEHVGKLEKGHTAIYLGIKIVNEVRMLHFWASSKSTDGYGEKMVPLTDAKRILFTRIIDPSKLENLSNLTEIDPFLESMLTQESSWAELLKASGIE